MFTCNRTILNSTYYKKTNSSETAMKQKLPVWANIHEQIIVCKS